MASRAPERPQQNWGLVRVVPEVGALCPPRQDRGPPPVGDPRPGYSAPLSPQRDTPDCVTRTCRDPAPTLSAGIQSGLQGRGRQTHQPAPPRATAPLDALACISGHLWGLFSCAFLVAGCYDVRQADGLAPSPNPWSFVTGNSSKPLRYLRGGFVFLVGACRCSRIRALAPHGGEHLQLARCPEPPLVRICPLSCGEARRKLLRRVEQKQFAFGLRTHTYLQIWTVGNRPPLLCA